MIRHFIDMSFAHLVSPVRLVSLEGIVDVDTACEHVLALQENIPGAVTDSVPRIPESGSESDPRDLNCEHLHKMCSFF